ncbi:hypothetical protein NV379_06950 [Paenibacillus sp. N1-5-1-14]|uniref:hypothetical protein n=1 Tax=Paenibacillus radicibacter TaxID=2972488 RepID=UPI0021592C17|nr:hypothetical protein [Paenibacillus radicibacter]MCR8642397.1 hypothetical protein [Paenibacillus radicibacter]
MKNKPDHKLLSSLVAKKGLLGKGKKMKLIRTSSSTSECLGGGFRRVTFDPIPIDPHSIIFIPLVAAANRAVVSAGWSITGATSAWATDSFPLSADTWIINLENPTGAARLVTPYLITKRFVRKASK